MSPKFKPFLSSNNTANNNNTSPYGLLKNSKPPHGNHHEFIQSIAGDNHPHKSFKKEEDLPPI
jgi:hypothetical protein